VSHFSTYRPTESLVLNSLPMKKTNSRMLFVTGWLQRQWHHI